MIESLRKWGNSWTAKILLGILALSMGAFWGITDLFTGRHPLDIVATVGDKEIKTRELRLALEGRIGAIEAQIGKRLTPDQIKQARLPNSVLMDMIQEALLDQESDRLNLVVTDATVKQVVTSNPRFFNEAKKFSRDRFEHFLKNNGLYEQKFLGDLKKHLRRQQLLKTFSRTFISPSAMSNLLVKAQFQERFGKMVTINMADMHVPAPASETLHVFYHQEKERFRRPETRQFVFAVLEPRVLSSAEEISLTELDRALEARAQEFKNQPTNVVREKVIQDLKFQKGKTRLYEIIPQIEDELAAGSSLEEVSKKYGLVLRHIPAIARNFATLKKQDQTQLPQDAELAQEILQEAFETSLDAEPTIRQTRNGNFGYVIQLQKIYASEIPPLDVVKEEVLKEWKKEAQKKAALTLARQEAQGVLQHKGTTKKFQILSPVSLQRGSGQDLDVPPQVKTVLFEMATGDVRITPALSGEVFVVQLLKIESGNTAAIQSQIPSFLDQLREMYAEDLIHACIQSLRPRYHIKVNRDAVNAVI